MVIGPEEEGLEGGFVSLGLTEELADSLRGT